MAQPRRGTIEIHDLRGGRNNADSPHAIADNQCVEAWDVDWFSGMLARKRLGSVQLGLTSGPSKDVRSLVPWRATATAMHLLAFENNAGTVTGYDYTITAGTWASLTSGDAWTDGSDIVGASLNGTVYVAGDTAVNRLHALDAGTSAFRPVGLIVPAAPTVANTGAGAYAATIRYYKVAYATISGSVTLRRSELSPSVSFTPSGAGTAARVTKPAAINEGETHWLLYGSPDNLSYFLLATTVVGTTTYDDSTAPASYTGDAPQLAGTNIPPPSVKAILSDGARLVMAIPWESSATSGQTEIKQNRVWFTRVIGASDIGDLESIPVTTVQRNYIDIGELNEDGPITGLGGPIDGIIYVFQANRIWVLQPTGDVTAPYTARCLTTTVGSINQRSIVFAEDEQGQPALYFLSRRGPYRLGRNGLESLTSPVEDLFDASAGIPATLHGLYHYNRRQVWWIFPYAFPVSNSMLVYDVKHDAYSRNSIPSGLTITASCAAPTVANDQIPLPYLGGKVDSSSAAVVRVYDNVNVNPQVKTDNGTAYRGYLITRAYLPAGLGKNCEIQTPTLLAEIGVGITIQVTTIRDFGTASAVGAVSLAADGSSSCIVKPVQGAELNGCGAVQFEIGDASAVDAAWILDGMTAPYEEREPRGL